MISPEEHINLPTTALAMLGLLSFGPQSGYDLKQLADRSIRHFYWSPAKSQVYTELRRLKSFGLVEESFIEQESRPDKRVYTITATGRVALAGWLNDPVLEPTVYKSTTLMKIFFGASAEPAALVQQLDSMVQDCHEFTAMLEETERQCSAAGDEAIFTLLTVRAGLAHARADIEWAEKARATLLSLDRRQQETT
jgi:DNA-binding PadR family transcriptional regulator